MREYSVGEEYEFIVNYYYTDSDDLGRERRWLSLYDGESEKKYNVPAYPYQKSGYEGKTIVCEVTRLLDNGYPYLRQNRAEVLAHCYNKGETYWFSVIDKHTDQNTQCSYYELIDRLNNIKHRYYCSEREEISGLVAFVVKKVNDRYLDIARVETKNVNKPAQDQDKLYNPFGHEDNYHEWKASLVFSSSGTDPDNPNVDQQIKNIMKSISGFQNAEGGLLYIGVTDGGEVCGIEPDYCHLNEGCDSKYSYQKNSDGYEQKIRNAVNYYLGKMSLEYISFKFYRQRATKRVFCIIEITKTPRPVFIEGKDVFKRFGNGFRMLKGDEITDLVIAKHEDVSEQKKFPLTMPKDCEELNPNVNNEPYRENAAPDVVRITAESLNKIDYYYMTFYNDDTFMYSKNSHASENGVIAEVRFNKKSGNLEYSRDLLIKFTKDGYAQFLQAYDMCRLGNADTRISLQTKNSLNILTVKVARKYDFVKVLFSKGSEKREKYLRVTSLFGRDTEQDLRAANKSVSDIKYEFKLKGNRAIPSEYTLEDAFIVHETLPDEIQFVSAKSSASQGYGCVVGSQIEDVASY